MAKSYSRHHKQGKTTKSPKIRLRMKMDAQNNDRKAKPSNCADTIATVFHK